MMVIVWSLFVIAISLAICQILRLIIRNTLREEIFKLIDEFLAAFQTSICILELGVVSNVYGFGSFVSALYIFIFGVIKHFLYIRGKYVANPVCFIDSFYNAGKSCVHSPLFIIYVVGAQILAALLAHPFAKALWGTTYSEYHNRILFQDCKTTLEVSFFHGFVVEIFTTFVAWSTDYFTPLTVKPPVRSAVSLSLALIFDGTSGVWMNPAVASAHTFNCRGHDNVWEHVITYWMGPFIAVILFYEIKEISHVILDRQSKTSQQNLKEDKVYRNGSDINGVLKQSESNGKSMHLETPTKREIVKEIQENGSTNTAAKKYHRSPGGSLRPRTRPTISPGW